MNPKKSWLGYESLVIRYDPETSAAYVRVSDNSQTEDSQIEILKEHFPDLNLDDDDIISHKIKGNTPVSDRLEDIPDNIKVVCSTHPDRVTKTDDCLEIDRMMEFFTKRELKVTFPDVADLMYEAEEFRYDPSLKEFRKMVSARMMAHANPRAESNTLSKKQKRAIKKVYLRLMADRKKSTHWENDHRFWALYAYAGYAVNQALKTTNAKAREKSDNTFGTKVEQIKLLDGMEDYLEDDPDLGLKKMSRRLAKNRGMTTEKGTQYKVSYLSRVKNDHLGAYRDFNTKVERALNWTRKPKVESKRKKVQPKNSRVKVGMEEARFDYLYKTQNKTLERLIKGKSVILQDRSGGGKSEIPIMYNFSTGKPVVVVVPTLALAENYKERVIRHFLKEEIAVYNSKTYSANPKTLSLLRRAGIHFLITTPEQMAKKELIDAIRKNGSGLLFFDECHNISFSGLTYRPKYHPGEIKKIVDGLDNFTCLFASATVDESSYYDITEIVGEYEYIHAPLSRPNLKLFRWKFETLGQKLACAHKLISSLRGEGYKKGILYFNTVDNGLLKVEEKFRKLGHPCAVYFGKDKEGWDWETKKKNLRKFASSKSKIMLTTTSFGEGLNFKDVGFVICMDMPGSVEELYQWVGRAGRGGENAPVFLMDDPQSRSSRTFLIESDKNTKASKDFQWEKYNQLLKFLDEHPKPSMKDLAEEI